MLITERYAGGCAGTTTAGLFFGGYNNALPPGNATNLTEEYDGTSWAAGGVMGTARYTLVGTGTQTAGLGAMGYDYVGPLTAATEEYNGTAWTAGTAANTARNGAGGGGVQTATLVFGGYDGSIRTGVSESYDGTSWITQPTMAAGRSAVGSASNGTTTAGLAFGGNPNSPPAYTDVTEAFTGETSAANYKTITTS